jgi:hypothetical protein
LALGVSLPQKINDILAVGLKGIKKIAVDKTEGQNVKGQDTGN